jgi:hypothetical protein
LRGFLTGRKRDQTLIVVIAMSGQRGTSKAYLISKLREHGRTDLVAAIEAGTITAYGCAVALGWRKRAPILGTGSSNRAKRRDAALEQLLPGNGKVPPPETDGKGELSLADAIEISELIWGPDQTGSVFATRLELENAWRRQRTVALELTKVGRKPLAWEMLERPPRKKKALKAGQALPRAEVFQ